jgi:hypothetical protein
MAALEPLCHKVEQSAVSAPAYLISGRCEFLREPGKCPFGNPVTEFHVLPQMLEHLGSRVGPEFGCVLGKSAGEADQPLTRVVDVYVAFWRQASVAQRTPVAWRVVQAA